MLQWLWPLSPGLGRPPLSGGGSHHFAENRCKSTWWVLFFFFLKPFIAVWVPEEGFTLSPNGTQYKLHVCLVYTNRRLCPGCCGTAERLDRQPTQQNTGSCQRHKQKNNFHCAASSEPHCRRYTCVFQQTGTKYLTVRVLSELMLVVAAQCFPFEGQLVRYFPELCGLIAEWLQCCY